MLTASPVATLSGAGQHVNPAGGDPELAADVGACRAGDRHPRLFDAHRHGAELDADLLGGGLVAQRGGMHRGSGCCRR